MFSVEFIVAVLLLAVSWWYWLRKMPPQLQEHTLPSTKSWSIRHTVNPRVLAASNSYPEDFPLQDDNEPVAARRAITKWSEYEKSRLVDGKSLATRLGIAKIWLKDETNRLGVGSFKSLGAPYAAQVTATNTAGSQKPVFATASAGNHGIGLSWGARRLGCQCHVYLHSNVPESAAEKIRGFGATVHRVASPEYAVSLQVCQQDAALNGWQVVQDVDSNGYEDIPTQIFSGYTMLAAEIIEQLDAANEQIPTHVLINTGVGGLACAVCAHFWQKYGSKRPRFICVEAAAAAGVQYSAEIGEMSAVPAEKSHERDGSTVTVQVGLDCKSPSPITWRILNRGANDFVSVSDNAVAPSQQLLYETTGIKAGESAVASLAICIAASPSGGCPDLAESLGIDSKSRVVIVICEGPTK